MAWGGQCYMNCRRRTNASPMWTRGDSPQVLVSFEVPKVGVEPTLPCGDWILSPARQECKGKADKDVAAAPENPLAHSLAREIEKCPELVRLIDAWPSLPDAIRVGILAMVEAAQKDR